MNIIQKLEMFKNTFRRNDSITLRYEDIIQILKLINKPVTTTNEQPNTEQIDNALDCLEGDNSYNHSKVINFLNQFT